MPRDTDEKILGERLKALRVRAGMTQPNIVAANVMTKGNLSRIEQPGVQVIQAEKMKALAAAFGMTLDQLRHEIGAADEDEQSTATTSPPHDPLDEAMHLAARAALSEGDRAEILWGQSELAFRKFAQTLNPNFDETAFAAIFYSWKTQFWKMLSAGVLRIMRDLATRNLESPSESEFGTIAGKIEPADETKKPRHKNAAYDMKTRGLVPRHRTPDPDKP